jgi:cell wall-associated NlpC family hydrolase
VTECSTRRPHPSTTARLTASSRVPATARVAVRRRDTAGLRAVVSAAMAAVLVSLALLGLTRSPARAAAADTGRATARAKTASAVTTTRRHPRRRRGISRRLRLDAWNWALRQRGKHYIWGGVGPRGFDCSGLVWAAYRSAGIALPRTTYEMLDSHDLIRISKRQARRGDLAFFGREHVELYRWGNWTFGAEHTGTRIGFHKMDQFWHPTMYFRVR